MFNKYDDDDDNDNHCQEASSVCLFGVYLCGFWEFVCFPNGKFGIFTFMFEFFYYPFTYFDLCFFVSLLFGQHLHLPMLNFMGVCACVLHVVRWMCISNVNCTFEQFCFSRLSSRFSFTRPLRSVDSVQNSTISQPKLDNFFSSFVYHIEQHNYMGFYIYYVLYAARARHSSSFPLQRKMYCTFCHSAIYFIV